MKQRLRKPSSGDGKKDIFGTTKEQVKATVVTTGKKRIKLGILTKGKSRKI